MEPIQHWFKLPWNKSQGQFSIRNILIVTVIVAIGVANPGIAIFSPFAIGLLLLIAAAIVIVGGIQIAFSYDRKLALAIAWKNLKSVLLVALALIAFTALMWWCYPPKFG